MKLLLILVLSLTPAPKQATPKPKPNQVANCSIFLASSAERGHHGTGALLEEEQIKLREFNAIEQADPAPNRPAGQADAVRAQHQANIDRLQKSFSDDEVRIWQTFGPTTAKSLSDIQTQCSAILKGAAK